MTHPSISRMVAELARDMSPEVLAETAVATVERFYQGGAVPTRRLLLTRAAEMISAIREGERLRFRERDQRLTRAVGIAGDYIESEPTPVSPARLAAVLAELRAAIDGDKP